MQREGRRPRRATAHVHVPVPRPRLITKRRCRYTGSIRIRLYALEARVSLDGLRRRAAVRRPTALRRGPTQPPIISTAIDNTPRSLSLCTQSFLYLHKAEALSDCWPEFAANDKVGIPARWLLSHQASLVALDRPVPLREALAWHPMVAALAAQRPLWNPGTAHGYHDRTWGWLIGEVTRRVSGRGPGRFLTDEIAAPLGLDLFIGLPAGERDRVSRMVYPRPDVDLTTVPTESVPSELREQVAAWRDTNSFGNRA